MTGRALLLPILLGVAITLVGQKDTLDFGVFRHEVIDAATFARYRAEQTPSTDQPGTLRELGDGRLFLTYGPDTLTYTFPGRLDTCHLTAFLPALRAHYLVCYSSPELFTEALVDAHTGARMFLPYDHDNGYRGLSVSPNGRQVLFYSSYDIPHWEDYYTYRAGLILYRVRPGEGLAGLSPMVELQRGDLSIQEVVWVDGTTVAMQVYFGDPPDERNAETYTYLKLFLQ